MSLLAQTYERFENRLQTYFSGANWQLKMSVWGVIFAVLSFFNNVAPLRDFSTYFQAIREHREHFAYQDVHNRAIDFQKNWVYPPLTGLNNRTFRLTQPFFVRLFHLYPATIWVYGIQLCLGFLFFYLLASYFYKQFQDKLMTIYLLVGIACIYPGTSFFIDFSGYGDFFSYFFLFLAIYFRNPWAIMAAVEAACWNDERAMVASGIVFVYWWFVPQWDAKKPFQITVNKQMLAIIAAWIIYFGLRFGVLVHYLGIHDTYTPDEFLPNFKGNIIVYGFKMFWGIEAFWLLVLLMTFCLLYSKDFVRLLLVWGAFLLILLLSMTIYDTTRSTSNSYVIIFIALAVLKNYLTDKELRFTLWLIALLCFLHPLATKTNAVGMFLM